MAEHADPVSALRVIAIDGPAGAGKSTIARALARRLGLEYLDTGAMYRAVAWAAVQRGIDLADRDAVAVFAQGVDLQVSEDGVCVDGRDATVAIRSPEVTAAVAAVASNPAVREELVDRQRRWGIERGGGVIEGRDIGSVVFPQAVLKLYLTASARVRAERRVAQAGGDIEQIAAAIEARDASDRARAHGPLTEADGAVVVDTTDSNIDQVVDRIEELLAAS